MANKTFTVSSTSPTAGQALDAVSVGFHVSGTLAGKFVLEVSPDNVLPYVPAHPPIGDNSAFSSVACFALSVPSGWFVRIRPADTTGTPNFTVVVA